MLTAETEAFFSREAAVAQLPQVSLGIQLGCAYLTYTCNKTIHSPALFEFQYLDRGTLAVP